MKHTAAVYENRRDRSRLEITCSACGLTVTTKLGNQPITKSDYQWAQRVADAHTQTGTTRF